MQPNDCKELLLSIEMKTTKTLLLEQPPTHCCHPFYATNTNNRQKLTTENAHGNKHTTRAYRDFLVRTRRRWPFEPSMRALAR
jgi:hypothetical protein